MTGLTIGRGAVVLGGVCAAVLLGGCGSSSYAGWGGSDMSTGNNGRQCFGANDCNPGQYCNQFGFCVGVPVGGGSADAGGGPAPPETIVHVDPPATGKRYVYVAVPDQDTVVKIDSVGLQVRTISVGKNPAPLRTLPGEDVALVLNRGAASATLLRTRADGGDDLLTFQTAAGLNQLTMSPDGRYGIAWFDLTLSGGTLSPRQTFQDVTLFALAAGKEQAVNLSVGFRPSQVKYAPDGSAAYVITEQGVSVIPLAQTPHAQIVPTVPLRKDVLAEDPADDVAITPDGKLALARIPKLAALRVVDLATRAIIDLPLDAEPSDVGVSPDGKLAVAILRDQKLVAFIPLPDALADVTRIEKVATKDYAVGQVVITADGKHGLLFTNAVVQKVLLVADLATHAIATFPLKKGVRAVYASPDGLSAVVIHNKTPGTPNPNDPLDSYLDKLEGYSLFHLDGGYAKLLPTDAAPGQLAFAPDGKTGYLLLSGTTPLVRTVEAIDLQSFLVTSVALGSPPVAVGVVPSTKQVYVAQDHPLGRMTFVDEASFQPRTLTGFGLNGQIIE